MILSRLRNHGGQCPSRSILNIKYTQRNMSLSSIVFIHLLTNKQKDTSHFFLSRWVLSWGPGEDASTGCFSGRWPCISWPKKLAKILALGTLRLAVQTNKTKQTNSRCGPTFCMSLLFVFFPQSDERINLFVSVSQVPPTPPSL